MNSKILSFVNKCESWKVEIKELHWAAKNLSQHKLCDDIASTISDFEDLVSEVEQSISGKIDLNTLNPDKASETNLKDFVEDVISSSKDFLKELEGMGEEYIGIKSECESFIGTMQRNLYLVNFTMKEELKARLKAKINESMPKSLNRHDEVDKFMGRKPKSIKARINQIYRIVKKYGIDSRKYNDEHWQAIEDYYRAISSLGCKVQMKPCGSLSNADSMESDGGYCDYNPNDNMPRSKQYAIKILFEDGMMVDGYIKCMAAGTVQDPFSAYDTCIVLWPKSSRILEGINEYGDNKVTREKMGMAAKRGIMNGDEKPYQNAMDSLHKRGSSKEELGDLQRGFEMENKEMKLTEAELKQLVKEAAIKLIKEYGNTPQGAYNVGKLMARQHFRDKDPHKAARTNYQHNCTGGNVENEREWRKLDKAKEMGYSDGKKEFNPSESVEEGDSGIHIKPSKEGTFTAAATKHGESVQGFASKVLKNKGDYSPAMVKKANFAKNAKKFKH